MTKIARLILDLKCHRRCSYCVNEMPHIKEAMRPVSVADLVDYDEVILSGGEPLLYPGPDKVREVAIAVKAQNPDRPLYLYISFFRPELYQCLDLFDGITYALHHPFSAADRARFYEFQYAIKDKPGSYRLRIMPEVNQHIHLSLERWDRIIKAPWDTEVELCPNEELLILEQPHGN